MSALFDAIILGVLALLPLINPPTTVALFLALAAGLSREEKSKQAFLTCAYVFAIMTLTYYIGAIVMDVFNISIPGLRIAGGGILVIIGGRMLFPRPTPAATSANGDAPRTHFAFIPLAMPSTAGPGTIALIISASAGIKTNTAFPHWVLLTAPPLIFLATSFVLWLCLRASDVIMRTVGNSGIDAISRMMGFLLVCMGVQFAINGALEVAQNLIDINFNAHAPV